MGEITYKIVIEHKSRGIGFSAKEALKNFQKQDSSPIKKVTFAGRNTNQKSEFLVVLDDQTTIDYLTNCIEGSGRMPHEKGAYQITDIELFEEEPDNTELKNTKADLASKVKALDQLQRESKKLRAELAEAQREEINQPLQGLLLYFENLDYKADNILDDSVDSGFLSRVLSGKLENKPVDYVNHVLGKELSGEEVQEALKYNLDREIPEADREYNEAKDELKFLESLKDGSSGVPESLVPTLINNIESKDHQKTISSYRALEEESEKKKELAAKVEGISKKFERFSEQISLLLEASEELPIIVYKQKNSLEIYFPFIRSSTKTGLINNLGNDLSFNDIVVEQLEHKFVAYKGELSDESEDTMPQSLDERLNFYISSIMEDVPFTLQAAGYNKVKPTILIS